jgi:hypothetical protein
MEHRQPLGFDPHQLAKREAGFDLGAHAVL